MDAGPGDLVPVMEEGWSSWQAVGKDRAPINRAVVGVVDAIDWLDPPALAPAGTPPPGKRP